MKQNNKPTAGRKRIESGLQKRRNITLSDHLAALAKSIGTSVSDGIRIALTQYKEK